MSEPALTPMQLRAARKLLRWTRVKLSQLDISATTIARFEDSGLFFKAFDPRKAREVLEAAGVEFTGK
jgi:hypothetical protein